MPRPYSLDLRERVLAAAQEDRFTAEALAARFAVGKSTVRGWVRQARTTGRVAPKPHGGGTPPKVDAAGAAVLYALVAEQNDRTLAELGTGYRERTGTTLSISAVWRACKRLDLRRKKKNALSRRADA